MSHTHENCTRPRGGVVCMDGHVTAPCDYEYCNDEYCVDLGHCACLCHSGKSCACGHQWPRQEGEQET